MGGSPEAVRSLDRLHAIADSLAGDPRALALLALGSAAATERLDRWSDLDFFAIVRPEAKAAMIAEVDWLARAHPIAWGFRNTDDGWKLLFADGVFCEFAVFAPGELAGVAFAPGRVVWARDGFDPTVCVPAPRPPPAAPDPDWLAGEVLSNLLVGLGRWHRGERLAGYRMVQSYAVDNLLRLLSRLQPPAAGAPEADLFGLERRFEARHPDLAGRLAPLLPGIDACPAAALAILDCLSSVRPVPPIIADAIRRAAAGMT